MDYVKKKVLTINDVTSGTLYKYFKVFVDGDWIGLIENFYEAYLDFLTLKIKYHPFIGVVLDI